MLLRMNAQQLISDLRAAGLRQSDIADSIGVTQCTVSRLANGLIGRFRYDIGENLAKLHRQRCSRRRK